MTKGTQKGVPLRLRYWQAVTSKTWRDSAVASLAAAGFLREMSKAIESIREAPLR